jgi:hypothetical protein
MKNIKISDLDGNEYKGQLPETWQEVPLGKYAALAAAPNLTERAKALAALIGVPADPLIENVRVYATIRAAAPFLFDGPLPAASEPLPAFEHKGIEYTYVGGLHHMNTGQYEALDEMLRSARIQRRDPITAAPEMLAVLYTPKGQEQTLTSVETTAKAFATLPVSLGYPVLQDFFLHNAKSAHPILTYFEARPKVEKMLNMVSEALSDSQASSWSLRRWLSLTWIRRVKKTL